MVYSSEISKAKVIDMTGKEQRVLQGYSALRTKKTEEPNDAEVTTGLKKDKFQLEKLCYNLDTLVDHCEHVRFLLLSRSWVNNRQNLRLL